MGPYYPVAGEFAVVGLASTFASPAPALPKILNMTVPQVGHFPLMALRPFFMVSSTPLAISFLALHLTQYPSAIKILPSVLHARMASIAYPTVSQSATRKSTNKCLKYSHLRTFLSILMDFASYPILAKCQKPLPAKAAFTARKGQGLTTETTKASGFRYFWAAALIWSRVTASYLASSPSECWKPSP
jgi:hypothetical protein